MTLAWNPNSESNIAGYRLYYGTSSGNYTGQIDAGNTTTATVTNITLGTAYFFAATAYNNSGAESAFSSELIYTVTTQTPTPSPGTPTPTPGQTPLPSPTATPTPPAQTELANISTRLFVMSGNSVMIGGFVIYGDVPKRLILRAIGPSLASVGISEAMPDPVLTLFDSAGTVIGSNDDWRSDQSQIIEETGLAPSDDHEAAFVAVLSPGSYTVTINDANDASGVALFELYDLDLVSSQFINLSTRGAVQTQDRVMIGGLIIFGQQPASFVVRALGPSLAQSGIQDPLLDPVLELYDGQGTLIMQNDNWRSDQEQQIIDSHLAPSDDRESAIVANLSPGSYSAVVRGTANSTGTALLEIYKLLP